MEARGIPRQERRPNGGGGVKFRSTGTVQNQSYSTSKLHPALLNSDIAKELHKITKKRLSDSVDEDIPLGIDLPLLPPIIDTTSSTQRRKKSRSSDVDDTFTPQEEIDVHNSEVINVDNVNTSLRKSTLKSAKSDKRHDRGGVRFEGANVNMKRKNKTVGKSTTSSASDESIIPIKRIKVQSSIDTKPLIAESRSKRNKKPSVLIGSEFEKDIIADDEIDPICAESDHLPIDVKKKKQGLHLTPASAEIEYCKQVIMFWSDANKDIRPVTLDDEKYVQELLCTAQVAWFAMLEEHYLSQRSNAFEIERVVRLCIEGALEIDLRHLLRPSVCPPPLQVGVVTDRLGAVMELLCNSGGPDEHLTAGVKELLVGGGGVGIDTDVGDAGVSRGTKGIFSEDVPQCIENEENKQLLVQEISHALAMYLSSSYGFIKKSSAPSLGQRGRYYSEVWQEEDAIFAMKGNRVQLLEDWTLLLRNYGDSHDGYYRDWALLKAASMGSSANKMTNPEPPVPSHVQHPASWGPQSRKPQSKLDPSRVHPAACSSTIVMPPGAASSSSKQDIDDMDLEYEQLCFQLMRQEMLNYIRLRHVLQRAQSDRMLNPVRERCQVLEDQLIKINNTIGNCERISNEKREPRATIEDSAMYLGACEANHIPHSLFIKNLKRYDTVEVLDNGTWTLGKVSNLRYDGNLLRNIKVSLAGNSEEKLWVSVEDGCLSPPGTHLVLAQFDICPKSTWNKSEHRSFEIHASSQQLC